MEKEGKTMKTRKMVGQAKARAQAEAAYKRKMQERFGQYSVEYNEIAVRWGWK
jgi:hypothetical protein